MYQETGYIERKGVIPRQILGVTPSEIGISVEEDPPEQTVKVWWER